MKKVGIIGGLGPLATVDLFNKIVVNTPAQKDQDNIPILIYNNPQIPDRTEAILNNGPSPVEAIIKTGKVLENMGADFLIMPCNTALFYHSDIQAGLGIELLHMIELTANYIKENNLGKVAILATKGTIKSKSYSNILKDNKINFYDPFDNEELIESLSYHIYEGVKKNNFSNDISDLKSLLDELIENEKVDTFILACTELPILFEKYKLDYKTIDPTLILAKEAIKKALNEGE